MGWATSKSKVDGNHAEIVKDLRSRGCSVTSTASLRQGEGDILVGYQRRNYLFEIKDPLQSKSKQKQTSKGLEFAAGWRGQRAVIRTAAEAWEIMQRDQDGI